MIINYETNTIETESNGIEYDSNVSDFIEFYV